MGMFDVIRYEGKLPDYDPLPGRGVDEWQTKSLNCCMDVYTITKDGLLLKADYEMVAYSEEEIKALRKEYGDGPLFNLRKTCGKRVDKDPILMEDFHGDIYFYGSYRGGEEVIWWDYRARFTNGRLESIVQMEEPD